MPHPSKWVRCHEKPTKHQIAWLNRLIDMISDIPTSTKVEALENITLGQASLLICRLRKRKKWWGVRAKKKRKVFQDIVDSVRHDLPAPGED